jgi:predicted small secreted protein
MKKLRLILTVFLASSAFAACSTSLTAPDDCPEEAQALDCGLPGSDG